MYFKIGLESGHRVMYVTVMYGTPLSIH